jgi:hypothetical protein
VEVIITELVVDHDQTLGVVGKIVFPRHANTTVGLYALL